MRDSVQRGIAATTLASGMAGGFSLPGQVIDNLNASFQSQPQPIVRMVDDSFMKNANIINTNFSNVAHSGDGFSRTPITPGIPEPGGPEHSDGPEKKTPEPDDRNEVEESMLSLGGRRFTGEGNEMDPVMNPGAWDMHTPIDQKGVVLNGAADPLVSHSLSVSQPGAGFLTGPSFLNNGTTFRSAYLGNAGQPTAPISSNGSIGGVNFQIGQGGSLGASQIPTSFPSFSLDPTNPSSPSLGASTGSI